MPDFPRLPLDPKRFKSIPLTIGFGNHLESVIGSIDIEKHTEELIANTLAYGLRIEVNVTIVKNEDGSLSIEQMFFRGVPVQANVNDGSVIKLKPGMMLEAPKDWTVGKRRSTQDGC